MKARLQKVHLRGYDLLAFALIIIATALRFVLIYFNWPNAYSDESVMGEMALHIAYNGARPIFYYGQNYMGPIEAYLAAPLFHIFGPSLFIFRLGFLGFFPLFALSMYYLTTRLYNRPFALFITLVLCGGSDETILRQVRGIGGYPETFFFAAFILLLVVWLVQTYPTLPQQRTTWPRAWVYLLLAIVIGLAFWEDLLIIPIAVVSIVLLCLFCRRELRSKAGIAFLLGLLIGAFPLIVYNVTAPITQNSLVVLYNLQHADSGAAHTVIQQILGTVGISIPDVSNFNPMCIKDVALLLHDQQRSCAVAQLSWGTVFFVVYAIALIMAGWTAWRTWRSAPHARQDRTLEQRQRVILEWSRLLLLVSAGGTLLAYITTPKAATSPAPAARYLICLLIALPAILWPLWTGVRTQLRGGANGDEPHVPHGEADGNTSTQPAAITISQQTTARRIGNVALAILRIGILLLFLVMSVLGVYRTLKEIPQAQSAYDAQGALVQHLEAIGATRFYSEYWTCNNLIFRSQEKLICGALEKNLSPGVDRYYPYRVIVNNTKNAAYVFPAGSPQITALDSRIQQHTLNPSYQREEFGNYVIYYIPR